MHRLRMLCLFRIVQFLKMLHSMRNFGSLEWSPTVLGIYLKRRVPVLGAEAQLQHMVSFLLELRIFFNLTCLVVLRLEVVDLEQDDQVLKADL
uniref:Uncharacterized protein n=1 Tax=Myoviridae sp. ct4uh47 TaxID=2825032 RepID=A0A8S5V5V7_9CAUD|nr:MAG TPA: hypothetical protein [Myoviridae sp. ct4uh47]